MKHHARFWLMLIVLMVVPACGKPTPSSAFPTSPPPTAVRMMAKSMSSEESTSFDLAYTQHLTPKEMQVLYQLPPLPSSCVGEIDDLGGSGLQVIRGTIFTHHFSLSAYSRELDGQVYFYAAILNEELVTILEDPERLDKPFWAPSKIPLLPEGLDENTYLVSITGTGPDISERVVLIYTARNLDGDDCGDRIVFVIEFI